MAKKAAGVREQSGGAATADVETRGRLPGEIGEFDSIQDEQTETMSAKSDGPIASLADLLERAATFTDDDATELRKSGHEFTGGWPGSSLNVKVKLSPEASNAMRKLYLALNHSNTRKANGRHVGSIADVVTWLMEDATRQIEERASA